MVVLSSGQITIVDVEDGKDGKKGDPGSNGKDGRSIRLFTTNYVYTHEQINQYSEDGYTGDWIVVENTINLKVDDGIQLRVFNKDKSCDSWIIAEVKEILGEYKVKAVSKGLIEKGDKGERGIQGLQGPKGDQGIPGIRGSDGRTQYTHLAYADDEHGGGFSQINQNKAYIGMYQDFVAEDSTDPTKYRWGKVRGPDGPQGIPGKPGADGKTPYIHFAYSESADGKQGFSITQTGNKRYIGTYTDYTKEDSTDPTKYRWVDMVGTVEVGGLNLLRNSAGPFKPDRKPTNYDNLEYYLNSTIDMINGKQYILTAETDGVFVNNHSSEENADTDKVVIWLVSLDYKIHQIISDKSTGKNGTVFIWNNPTGTYMLRVNTYKTIADKSAWKIKIAEGNTKTGWSPAPEDIEASINSKADGALTQEQINALNEKNAIMKAEWEAKASLDTLNKLIAEYTRYKLQNDKDKDRSEKDLVSLNQRLVENIRNLKELAERWNFLDKYFQVGNEGIVFGEQNGNTCAKMSNDRFSIFSAGTEVMYISQGTLFIENGIFSKSIQIGRFREEQYRLNLDMNIIKYVGGV